MRKRIPIGSFVDVTPAPFGNATQGGDTPLSSTERVAPYGTQPDAVGEICQLTYFCSQGNIHANTAGYTFIGQLAVAHYESLFDVTPPAAEVVLPSSGAALKGSTYFDAVGTDNVGVTKVQFILTGGTLNHSVVGTAVPTIFGYVYQFNSASVPNGSYTLQGVAYDAAGNAGSSAGVTISVDN